MKKQEIVWTVLPDGMGETEEGEQCLKLSVFVSPRLGTTDASVTKMELGEFLDFLNWSEKVKEMEFKVEFDNGSTAPATLDDSDIDAELWSALFKEDTFVRPYEFTDYKDITIHTSSVQGVLSYLKNKYATIAENSPDSLPLLEPRTDDDGKPIDDENATLKGLIDDLGDLLKPEKKCFTFRSREERPYYDCLDILSEYEKRPKEVGKVLKDILKKHMNFTLSEDATISRLDEKNWRITDKNIVYKIEHDTVRKELTICQYRDIYEKLDMAFKRELRKSKLRALDPDNLYGFTKEKLDFLQAYRFYDRPETKEPYYPNPNAKLVPPSPEIPEIDFHQMLALLGDHPLLMCKLGLVLDLTIPIPDNSFSSIRMIPPSNKDSAPWTNCIFQNGRFIAQPKTGSNIKDRMLNLEDINDNLDDDNAPYNLVQVDPDGAALKLVNSAGTMSRQIKRRYLASLSEMESKRIVEDCDIKIKDLKGYSGEIHEDFGISDDAKISKIASNKWMVTDGDKVYEIEYTGKKLIVYKKMNPVAYDTPDDAGTPSLRSAGIGLTKRGGAYNLSEHFIATSNKNTDLENNNPVMLYADDLVRGYRVDILDDKDGEWRSLCRRVGACTFTSPEPNIEIQVDDEGYVKGASITSKDGRDSDDIYFHETVFRWEGWGLCAQRPGKTIVPETTKEEAYLFNWNDVPGNNDEFKKFLEKYLNARWVKNANIQKAGDLITVTDTSNLLTLKLHNDTVTLTTDDGIEYPYIVKEENGKRNIYTTIVKQDEKVEVPHNKAETEFKLESVFKAKPNTLPRLRFGHKYRMRARVVDITGNSKPLNPEDSSLESASDPLSYARFEPVIPPTLVPRARISEGESVERMVIRSNFDKTTKEYIESNDVKDALKDEDHTYDVSNERHIVPPKTSQLMAETHGMFDDYFTPDKYEEGYNIALKEEGTLADTKIVDITDGKAKSIPNPADVEIIKPSDGTEQGQYIIHKENQLLLPYLPDPIARGTAFRNLPGVISEGTPELEKIIKDSLGLNVLKVPFELKELKWYDAQPFQIRIEERPGKIEGDGCDETFDNVEDPPKWDSGSRILTVYLPKAEVAKVRYTCYMNDEDLQLMGIWNKWLKNPSNNLKRYALSGTHWMLTPFRELVVVHAVQQPLCEPTIPDIEAIKNNIGDTFATIEGEFHLSVKSTDKLDLLANWTEPDDIDKDGPKTSDVNAYAFELKIDESFNDDLKIPLRLCGSHRHEFGDTKYRHVKYYLQGTTRFREYFPTEISKAKDEYCFDWNEIPGNGSQPIIDFLRENRKIEYTENATIEKSVDGETITVTENGVTVTLRINKEKNAIILTIDGKKYVYVLRENNDGKLCIGTDKITRKGPVCEVDVLNSARPDAPKVLYALPTFKWEEEKDAEYLFDISNNINGIEGELDDGQIPQELKDAFQNNSIELSNSVKVEKISDNEWRIDKYLIKKEEDKLNIYDTKVWTTLKRTRIGGGLRVYLERPWYSSGDKELLGVVLCSNPADLIQDEKRDKLKPYITQWGMDPIWKSNIPKGFLTPNDFVGKEKSQKGLSLEELGEEPGDSKLNVVGFKPEFNKDRKLWYCDIQFNPEVITSYYPFVRLALARYQPNSIENAHLSRAVLADFAQLVNDRALNIKFYKDNKTFDISVSGCGTADSNNHYVEVTIETYDPNKPEKFGWVPVKTHGLAPKLLNSKTLFWKWSARGLKLLKPRSEKRFRLVVREYERFKADVYLFSLNREVYKRFLKSGDLNKKIISAFKDRGFTLGTKISKIDDKNWEISDVNRAFKIKDTGTKIEVYLRKKPRLVYADVVEIPQKS